MSFECVCEIVYDNGSITLSCNETEIKNLKLCENVKMSMCPVDNIPQDRKGKLRDYAFDLNFAVDLSTEKNKLRVYCSNLSSTLRVMGQASGKWSDVKIFEFKNNHLTELK